MNCYHPAYYFICSSYLYILFTIKIIISFTAVSTEPLRNSVVINTHE